MRNRPTLVLINCFIILLLGLLSCTPKQKEPVVLTISISNTAKEVLAELDKLYKQENPNITINYVVGNSADLTKQIKQGVPADMFISASSQLMDELQTKGLVIPETQQSLMKNSLVIITHQDSTLPISNFRDLSNESVKRVALGTERLPAGVYTKEVLTSLGIYESIKKKGVFTQEGIRQVLRAVEMKEVEAGITYSTEAKVSNKVKIVAVAPENFHSSILYRITVLKRCQNVPEAKEFIRFLTSDQATPIFEKYGFTPIKPMIEQK